MQLYHIWAARFPVCECVCRLSGVLDRSVLEGLVACVQASFMEDSTHTHGKAVRVCRACEVSAKDCMKKRNGAEAFKCRWQVQRHQYSVPSCTQKSVSMSMYFQQS